MITREEITEIDRAEFDELFEHSLPYMDQGTFNWTLLGSPETTEEKCEKLYEHFQRALWPSSARGLIWRENGSPLSIAVGGVSTGDEKYITWILSLYGPDANGSRAYMHSQEFVAANTAYLKNVLGLSGMRISCIKESGMMNTHVNKTGGADLFDITVEDTEPYKGVEFVRITYTYK